MNLDFIVQSLAAEVTQAASNPSQTAEPGQDSGEFEAMLRQQSGEVQSQKEQERPAGTPAKKQEAQKPKENSTKEEEVPKEGSQLAASMVTSQPVVLFDVLSEEVQAPVQEAGVLVEDVLPEAAPVLEEAAPMAEEILAPVQNQGGFQEAPVQVAENAPQAVEVPAEARVVQEAPVEQVQQPQDGQNAQVEQEAPQQQGDAFQAAASQAKVQAGPQRDEEVQVTDVWQEAQPVFQQVNAVPVKVSEGEPEAVEVQEPEAPQKLAAHIDQALAQGESRVELQLSPANLGKLTVEITRSQDGTLSVVLNTATEKAAEVLRQHSGALQNAMMNSAQAPVTVEVQQPRQAEDTNQFLNPDGQNRQDQRQNQQQGGKKHKGESEDFIQQLRLGLVGLNKA